MTFVLHGYVINPSPDADGIELDSMWTKTFAGQPDVSAAGGGMASQSPLASSNCSADGSDRDRGTRFHNDQSIA
jgi:hypothetical protein